MTDPAAPGPGILILPNVTCEKYHDADRPLPFEATPRMVKRELERRLPGVAVDIAGTGDASRGELAEARIILAQSLTREMLDAARRAEWVQFPGSGPDHFFKFSGTTPEDFRRRGVKLLNSPGISRIPVAEQVMALALALVRGIPRALRQQGRREWRIFCTDELAGKTCGIIGLGAIGARVAELARAFGMRVIGTRRRPGADRLAADQVYGPEDTDLVVREADVLVLACPLTPETRGMMDARRFALMKPTAYFINISRGENVDEPALVEALRRGTIAGAGLDTFGPLDVTDHKLMEALRPTSGLWELDNVIVMPNNAASTPRYFEYFADLVAENYRRAQRGEPFISQVA
jgi:phosphoglycerate dehydrogenase-like enzyme